METPFDAVRSKRDCSRQTMLCVKKRLNGRDISAAQHRADFRHAVAFVQLGYSSKFTPSVAPKDHLAEILG